ncbi:hypothetical protein [Pseudoduganella sp. OTU4001]|uniref:hypothetical protein n=1 Tax=Pseudoduganella sp. OTU4001 TaxID=3043854 RepID=UPI00313E4222
MRVSAIMDFCLLTLADAVAAQQPLHVLVENAASPYSNPDGTGVANDVVRAAFDVVGMALKLTIVQW